MSVTTIDCEYLDQPGFAAAYLIHEGDRAAFVETNTNRAVPRLLEALAAIGVPRERVELIVITHVHLDHAGGASALARACPNAKVLAHPRAARHLIDPAKLVASARGVYGEERFAALYGTIEPIDASRVEALDDGATRPLGDATLRFLHTRGHANHHFVVHDPAYGTVFTGDTFGLVYPRLQRGARLAYPSTSPTDFDAVEARKSLDVVLGLETRSVSLTHFGELEDREVVAAQLRRWLDVSEALVEEARGRDDAEAFVRARLEAEMTRAVTEAGLVLDESDRALIGFDLDLNAQGLAFAAKKAR